MSEWERTKTNCTIYLRIKKYVCRPRNVKGKVAAKRKNNIVNKFQLTLIDKTNLGDKQIVLPLQDIDCDSHLVIRRSAKQPVNVLKSEYDWCVIQTE